MAEQTYVEGYLAGLREAASIATQEIEDDPGYLRFAEDGKDIAVEIREDIKRVIDKSVAPGMARIMAEGAKPTSFYSSLITALRETPQRGQDVFNLMALYERQRTDAADALTAQFEHLVDMQAKVQEWRQHTDDLAQAIGKVLVQSGIATMKTQMSGPDMVAACAKLGDLVDTLQRREGREDVRSNVLNEHAARWEKLRNLFGLDGWHDGVYHGRGTVDQIVTHIEHVANERARLLVANTKLEDELKVWTDNVSEILKDDIDVIRCHEGNGPERLVSSLVITLARTRKQRDELLNKHRQALATLDSRNTQMAGLVATLNRAERGLRVMSGTLDQWASESEKGGWSTHQVTANRVMADACRRDAGFLRWTADQL